MPCVKIGLSWPSLSKALGRPVARSLALGGALSRLRQGQPSSTPTREIVAINRKGEIEDDQRAILKRHRRHRAARRHLEPGQGAVVAQCLDAEVPARHPRPGKRRRVTASCAASRAATACPPSRRRRCCWRVWRSGPISPTTLNASFERMLAQVSRGAERDAGTRAETATKRDYRRRKRNGPASSRSK